MEKLIKITARMMDGSEREFRTTNFKVKPFRNAEGLYVELNDGYTFTCKSVAVTQKDIQDIVVVENKYEKVATAKTRKPVSHIPCL